MAKVALNFIFPKACHKIGATEYKKYHNKKTKIYNTFRIIVNFL
jgi:hypothetical protein